MSFTLVTLTGTFERPNGEPAQGTVTAQPSTALLNGTQEIPATPIVGQLNGEGKLKAQSGEPFLIAANDDPGTAPTGSHYRFTLEIDNAPARSFFAQIRHAAPGGTLDISELETFGLTEQESWEAAVHGEQTARIAADLERLHRLPTHETLTGPATAGANELTPVNAEAGAVPIKLPTGLPFGTLIAVEKTDASANAVTLEGSIRGEAATIALVLKRETLLLEAEPSGSWRPLASHKTLSSLDARYDATGSAATAQKVSIEQTQPPSPVTLTEKITAFTLPANSTLAAGHEWKLGSNVGAGSNLNYTGDNGLSGQCIKLESKGEGKEKEAQLNLKRLAERDMTGKSFRAWFKIDEATAGNLERIRMRFGSGAAEMESQFKVDFIIYGGQNQLIQYGKPGEWFSVKFTPAGMARNGTPNWAKIQDFRLGIEDIGGAPVTVLFGGIDIVDNDARYPEGVISIGADDNYLSQLAMGQFMAGFGMKGTLYLTQDAVGENEHLTLAMIEHMQRVQGWDVGVHCELKAHNILSPSTGMTTLTEQVFNEDLTTMQQYLRTNGLYGGRHHAIPSGCFTPTTLAWLRRKFSSARTVSPYGIETVPPADPMRLRCQGVLNSTVIGPDTTPGSVEWTIKEMRTYGGWLHLLFHNMAPVGAEPNTLEEAKFKSLIEYIAASGVPVRKVSEVLGV